MWYREAYGAAHLQRSLKSKVKSIVSVNCGEEGCIGKYISPGPCDLVFRNWAILVFIEQGTLVQYQEQAYLEVSFNALRVSAFMVAVRYTESL